MIIYKYFMRIASKHKFVILGYAAIFLLLSVINSASTKDKDIQFSETKLNIGIIDNMNSELSNGLTKYLDSKHNIIDTKEDEEYIKEQLFIQMVDGVIIIPKDFDERVINKNESIKLYKNDMEAGSYYLEQQIEKYLVFANATLEDEKFDLNNLELALDEKANVVVLQNNENRKDTGANSWFKYYYNFTSYIIIAIYVAVIGLVMVEFKDEKIEARMKISSKRLSSINRGIYLGQITIGAIITSIFILGSILLRGKHLAEVEFTKYVVNIIVFSFAILCFTFLISNVTGNRFVINGISTVVSLGTSFISGVMVPQEYLSSKVLNIAKFFPTYYFVRINDNTMNALSDIKDGLIIQIMFGITFLLMGLYFSRVKQRA